MSEKICNALINENYDYMLSGDCLSYCKCMLNDKRCIGMEVEDPEDRSSQFFSRGKNVPSKSKLKKCPVYGSSLEVFTMIVKERAEREPSEKLDSLKSK